MNENNNSSAELENWTGAQVPHKTIQANIQKQSSFEARPILVNQLVEEFNLFHDQQIKQQKQPPVFPQTSATTATVAVGGFDIMRLHHPSVENLNEDFICGLCKKIVMNPMECSNGSCSALYCKSCLENSERQGNPRKCKLCSKTYSDPSKAFIQPSKVILKLLLNYQILCQFCKKAFPMREVIVHETLHCLNTRCANELCGAPLDQLPEESLVKFTVGKHLGDSEQQEKIACSKKCKTVAKFGFTLKNDSECAVLKAFESMLRKKMQKKQHNNQTLNALVAGHYGRFSLGLPQSGTRKLVSQRGNIHHSNTIIAKGNSPGQQEKRGRAISQNQRNGGSTSVSATQRNPTRLAGGPLIIKEEELKSGQVVEDYDEDTYNQLLLSCLLNSNDAFHDFTWDPEHSSKDIHFSKDCRHTFLSQSNYYFRTVVSNRPFSGGVHYWEIIADSRTEHELKVGVTTQQQFNVNSSFSDYEFGWAYYGLGQLRHNSNSEGPQFGKQFKKKGILGVCLNMNTGTLSFALDGEYMGVAFEDQQLRKGPIYAAISLLHIAGCTLVACVEKPSYFP